MFMEREKQEYKIILSEHRDQVLSELWRRLSIWRALLTFVAIILDNNSQHGDVFSSPVETLGYRHRRDKELVLHRFVLGQESMTKGDAKYLRVYIKKEITVMDRRLSGS